MKMRSESKIRMDLNSKVLVIAILGMIVMFSTSLLPIQLVLTDLQPANTDYIYMVDDWIITENTVLTNDVVFAQGKGIIISASDIVLDGAGHSISAEVYGYGTGIKIYAQENVVVKNLEIFNFEYGIRIRESDNCLILNNNIHHNKKYNIEISRGACFNVFKNNIIAYADDEGIHISGRYWQTYGASEGNVLMNNYFYENKVEHIYLLVAVGTVIIHNTLQGGGTGVYVKCSNDTIIRDNIFIETGIELRADVVYGEYYNVERTKIIGNRFKGGGIKLNSRVTQVIDTVIIDNELIDANDGIRLIGGKGSIIMHNKISGGNYGIRLETQTKYAPRFNSTDNKIVNNEIVECTDSGIILMEGDQDNNEIINNKVLNNGKYGIYVSNYANGNRIVSNTARGNGIYDLYDWSLGIENTWIANKYDTANW